MILLVCALIFGCFSGLIIISYAITPPRSPDEFPLQAGSIKSLSVPGGQNPIQVQFLSGVYKVRDRKLVAWYKIANDGKAPVKIGEFATAGFRFLNPDVYTSRIDYPENFLADHGLSLPDNSPIQPGETREHEVTLSSDRLSYDVDNSPAGLLSFFTPDGTRYQVEVGGFWSPLSSSSWHFKK